MSYNREAGFLKDEAGPFVLSLMKEYSACIAGGALTSAFSSSRINDFDVFFPSPYTLEQAIRIAPRDDKTIETDSALSIISEGHRVQLIKVLTGSPEQVIDSFDFTICQAAFQFKPNETGFWFGKGFFPHLAQRRLVFNVSAEYPVCSLFRVAKYLKRGFHFSGIEAIKLGLRIQALEIEDYKELRRQLMGIDTLFLKDLTDSLKGQDEKKYELNEFLATMEVWLDKLNTLTGQEE
jgi:hypothetical protein